MIIGICGETYDVDGVVTGTKGAGKDAFATALEEHGFHRIAFADALKRTVMDLYDLTWDQCFGTMEQKETIDPRWGVSGRFLMQKVGTEVGRTVHPETWPRKLRTDMAHARRGRLWSWNAVEARWYLRTMTTPVRQFAVPDVRFPNEGNAIHADGGVIVKIRRPDRRGAPRDVHASETETAGIVVDHVVENDGGLDKLRVEATSLVRALRAGTFPLRKK